MQIIAYQEGTKINTEVNEEYWYTLDYKSPLISTSTSFLQPSPRRSITWMVVALCHWSVCLCMCADFTTGLPLNSSFFYLCL